MKAAKKAAKQGDDGAGAFVDLEGGLAITLNLEISPHDPAGITAPYKLLVPALHYDGTEHDPPATQVVKGWRKWLNLPRRKKRAKEEVSDEDPDEDFDDYEDHDTISNTRANAAATTHQYEGYPGSEDDDSEGEVPQRLPPSALAETSPDYSLDEEEPIQQRRRKWLGMI